VEKKMLTKWKQEKKENQEIGRKIFWKRRKRKCRTKEKKEYFVEEEAEGKKTAFKSL
jgi:hypothetical protein